MKLFFSINESGCAWWRARLPAKKIRQLGLADVEVFSQATTTPQDLERFIEWSEIIISQSMTGVHAVAMLLKFKEQGKRVVVDYDDFSFACSPFNPGYKTLGLREVKVRDKEGNDQWLWKDGVQGFSLKDNYFRYRSQQDVLAVADMVTVTTQHLKDRYGEMIPHRYNDIKIMANSIDFDLFRPFEYHATGPVRIGWTASSSHLCEIWMVRDIMKEVFNRWGNRVKFVILGDVPELKSEFTEEQLEFHDFVDLSVYPLKLASLELDIGMCPLEKNDKYAKEFNRCKSQLKWSEFAAFKVPSVVSDLEPYECVEDGITGFKARDDQDFADKLSILIENSDARKRMGQNAFDKNYEDFNLEKNVRLFVKEYSKLLTGAEV